MLTTLILLAAVAQASTDPLAAFRPLVGYCWSGTFPDGKNRDRHCFDTMYDGKYVRDRHEVTPVAGPRPPKPYGGETIYAWDDRQKKITFTYYNSLGGVSTGTVEIEGGALVFPERHVDPSGEVKIMRNVWRLSPDHYTATLSEEAAGKTLERWRMTLAKDPSPDARRASQACADPAHHQFDFWIGTWRVERPDGSFAGNNTISSILDGCVLHEQWSGAKGMNGESFSAYDASRGRWHQSWVDTTGTLLLLDGAFAGGKMVLSGTRKTPKGEVRDRVTWSQVGPGVQQVWDTSEDGGTTWTNVFTGMYIREK